MRAKTKWMTRLAFVMAVLMAAALVPSLAMAAGCDGNHDWDQDSAQWRWSNNNREAWVTVSCKGNPEHTLTLQATVTFTVQGDSVTFTATAHLPVGGDDTVTLTDYADGPLSYLETPPQVLVPERDPGDNEEEKPDMVEEPVDEEPVDEEPDDEEPDDEEPDDEPAPTTGDFGVALLPALAVLAALAALAFVGMRKRA